jgi:hypothetical protein
MGTKRASFVEYAQKILGIEFLENPSSGSGDSAEKVLSSSKVSNINRSKETYIFWACAFSGRYGGSGKSLDWKLRYS